VQGNLEERSRTNEPKKLLDLRDGIPFVNEGGLLKKTTKILKEIPRFKIELVETGALHEYDFDY
jgi:hypothetical protein